MVPTPMAPPSIVVLVGPTAAGKSGLAVRLAEPLGAEIVSADSMQVYRGMDVGTAKPSLEERRGIPHHLIDIADPDESFHAARYQREADRAISDIVGRGRVPLVVGGTGLYVKALLHGLFPESHPIREETWMERLSRYAPFGDDPHALLQQIDPQGASRIHCRDRARAQRALDVYLRTGRSISELQKEHGFRENRYRALVVGLCPERMTLYRRIEKRVDRMMKDGLLEEVAALLAAGYGPELPSMKALGYRHMVSVLKGKMPLESAVEALKRDTRRYAKRQITWFRNQEEVFWTQAGQEREILDRIQNFLARS